MTERIIEELRKSSANLQNAIIPSVKVDSGGRFVTVNLITDRAFTAADKSRAENVLRKYVPEYFGCAAEISKLTPDADMVKRKISEAVSRFSKAVFATITDGDITVEKRDGGFHYSICVAESLIDKDLCVNISEFLKKCFCGDFYGECVVNSKGLDGIEVEETPDFIDFEIPVRTFEIEDFEFLEGDKIQKTAIYLSDLNFASEEVIICGTIEDIRERTYVNKKEQERTYLSLVINDTTASAYVTYFVRQKSAEKIKRLKTGDSIVCTGVNEEFKGNLRYTAKTIDFGRIPAGFVPEKKVSKPVPPAYRFVKPRTFSDTEQTDLFSSVGLPDCLTDNNFVVFDLETTGLNSSPAAGNMDKIIEIGAYKIIGGEIKESFTTFINPEKKLSEEIIKLTGITPEMVENAPVYEDVLPDFFKFCDGCILVGHNIAGFDFKFVDYYCTRLGYILERKLIDTLQLSQSVLFLSNYKLNTVADHFGITFNHHRAIDDALATAKAFIELIKIKKSLPDFQ